MTARLSHQTELRRRTRSAVTEGVLILGAQSLAIRPGITRFLGIPSAARCGSGCMQPDMSTMPGNGSRQSPRGRQQLAGEFVGELPADD